MKRRSHCRGRARMTPVEASSCWALARPAGHCRTRAGMTLVEALVAGLMMVCIGAGLWTLIRSSYDSQYTLMNRNTANTDARQVLDTLADKLRGAASITSADASDITFRDNAGSTYRYWKSNNKLVYSVNGSPTNGNQILQDVQSLSLTYWTYSGSVWTTYSSVSGASLSTIAEIDIAVTCAVNGESRQMRSGVRLRQIQRF